MRTMIPTRLYLVFAAALGLALAACDEPEECVCDDDDLTGDDDDATADDDVTDDDDDSEADDADADGFTIAQGDCDDSDAAIHPGADEGCDDGLDSDCDGVENSGCDVEIDAGDVLIGSDEMSVIVSGQYVSYWDERPEHEVYLGGYHLDIYEVTNFQYRRCVAAAACTEPTSKASRTRDDYYDNPEYGGFPVVGVTYEQASQYCAFAGKRLPTEAEWEKGAKGPAPNDQTAPWGYLQEDEDWTPLCDKGNYGLCTPDTTLIGSYEDGISHYGLYDMTGNVMEWVADWFHTSYYNESPSTDPTGPDSGNYRVVRGGSWNTGWFDGRVVRRRYAKPEQLNDGIGIRCARD